MTQNRENRRREEQCRKLQKPHYSALASYATDSPILNRSERDKEERADANTFLLPGQRQLIDDLSNLRQQLEVAERELDFARFGFSYANENRSQLSANWDFSVDGHTALPRRREYLQISPEVPKHSRCSRLALPSEAKSWKLLFSATKLQSYWRGSSARIRDPGDLR